jgi:hypothetical protein
LCTSPSGPFAVPPYLLSRFGELQGSKGDTDWVSHTRVSLGESFLAYVLGCCPVCGLRVCAGYPLRGIPVPDFSYCCLGACPGCLR